MSAHKLRGGLSLPSSSSFPGRVKLIQSLGLLLAFLASFPAAAGWSSTSGKVQNINVYGHTSIILFSLANQPTGPLPPGCTNMSYFAIDGTFSAEKRAMFLSMLMSADAGRRDINVSWDDAGSCITYETGVSFPRMLLIQSKP